MTKVINPKKKYAVQILFYDCDQFILRTIENCAPHVDKIYVTYSPFPWAYNKEARDKFKNPSKLNIIENSKYRDLVEIIQGDWLTEESQRNEVLDKAKAEGYDYMIVQDADEFFHASDFVANLREIEANPDYAYYRTPWYQFWKSLQYIVICRYSNTYRGGKVETSLTNTPISYSMAFALNLKTDVRFKHCRRPTCLDNYHILSGMCYHLSYVMTDAQVERKIQTYGHSQQIEHSKWLRRKWYGWRPTSKNLHPINPGVWSHAEIFKGELPEVLKDFSVIGQESVRLSFFERMHECLDDGIALLIDWAKRIKQAFKAR